MADGLFCNESPVEFFKEQVECAMERQRLKTSPWTSYYVVNLLAGFVAPDRRLPLPGVETEPLGMRLVRALQAEGPTQREALRNVGDESLFLVGFFPDSLSRRLVDVDYYISIGGSAYGRLAASDDDAFGDVFAEMADKFVPLADVLADISDRASFGRNQDVLRIYERWLRTGSQRDGELLAERGVVANWSAPHRLQ
jgi:hypothetical protein